MYNMMIVFDETKNDFWRVNEMWKHVQCSNKFLKVHPDMMYESRRIMFSMSEEHESKVIIIP